jgi:hypothetical protein
MYLMSKLNVLKKAVSILRLLFGVNGDWPRKQVKGWKEVEEQIGQVDQGVQKIKKNCPHPLS